MNRTNFVDGLMVVMLVLAAPFLAVGYVFVLAMRKTLIWLVGLWLEA